MALGFWFACALGVGGLASVESWAWMRHGQSAIGLAVAGTLSLGVALACVAIVASIAYGVVGGITGWDPAGMLDEEVSTAARSPSCDSNYKGECLDPNASDYDCEGGRGNGPEYAGPVDVAGDDPYGLDADGDGFGCE
jgi:hypothetical protein